MTSHPLSRVTAVLVAAVLAVSIAACTPSRPGPTAHPSATRSSSASPSPTQTQTQTPTPTFDKARLSIDDPTSLWIVVNKLRPLSTVGYVPPDLTLPAEPNLSGASSSVMRAEATTALEQMFAAAVAEGAGRMQIQNAYRSYAVQTSVHNRLVATLGAAKADAQSARPGYSEHQTGLAVDIAGSPSVCEIAACFATTPQGAWLAANSYRFGFILRYPSDKQSVTGYIFEPWHYRYVGVALATEMHTTGITTMEEFFGLPAAPDYAG